MIHFHFSSIYSQIANILHVIGIHDAAMDSESVKLKNTVEAVPSCDKDSQQGARTV